ncbi:MAG: circadian clock KaiB family protein [Cyanobacteria bacterium P01_H01_bin.119]
MTSDPETPNLPQTFKGIALFTPGGDLLYAIDAEKQARWHVQLCGALQEIFDLRESPHFLVPCYTATVDRWQDPQTQQIQTAAEAYPAVLRHRAVLSAIFGLNTAVWKPVYAQGDVCDPLVIETYRHTFGSLWDNHNLVMQISGDGYPSRPPIKTSGSVSTRSPQLSPPAASLSNAGLASGFVFRLYVSGQGAATTRILSNLHERFEQFLHQPYTLKMVDVGKYPEQAEQDQISATPTLIRVWPHPVRRVVGEVTNLDALLPTLVETELVDTELVDED